MVKKSDLIKDYCKEFPNEKIYTLASIIFKKHPSEFKSLEQIRSKINYIKGHTGNKHRKYAAQPTPLNFDTTRKNKIEEIKAAKILILDIETAPLKAFIWDIWNQNIGIHQITSDWFVFTWAAKWLFEKKIYSSRLTSEESKNQNDKRIMQNIWELLNEADVVITHNGDKFDLPRINTRFLLHKIPPPQPYQSIDTLKSVRKQFGFVSNKQEFLNKKLGTPLKVETGGFDLWGKCYDGCEKSLKKMELYNIGDVKSLEDNYLKIRAWIKPHPNLGLFILDEHERCPSCGSNDLTECGKQYATTVNLYESLKCNNCGAYGRRKKSTLTVSQRKKILSSLPK